MSTPSVDPASAGTVRSTDSAGRKLARWTTNLLASGLVLIVGLVAGREVLLWWRSPADAAGAASATALDDEPPLWNLDDEFFDLRFGAAPLVVRRQVLSGDRPAVLAALRRHSTALAQEALAQERSRGHFDEPRASAKREDAESQRRLLARLASLTPASSDPGHWALYEWSSPLPANVVLVDRSSRILAWGLAFPETKSEGNGTSWSLFSWAELATTDRPDSTADDSAGQVDAPAASSPAPHRPEGTTPGLCITSPDGAALATFQARGGTAWIERHYDDWARRAGSDVVAAWRSTGKLRSARYRSSTGSSMLVQLDGSDPALVRGIVTQWPK